MSEYHVEKNNASDTSVPTKDRIDQLVRHAHKVVGMLRERAAERRRYSRREIDIDKYKNTGRIVDAYAAETDRLDANATALAEGLDVLRDVYGVAEEPEDRQSIRDQIMALLKNYSQYGSEDHQWYTPPPRDDEGVSNKLLDAALKLREDFEYTKEVTAAIQEYAPKDTWDDEREHRIKDPDWAARACSLDFSYDRRRSVIRDIAKAMKRPLPEFLRDLAKDIGEPPPKWLTSLPGSGPIVFPTVAEVLAVSTPPTFLVEGLIPDRQVSLAHGPTSAGKTYFCLEVAAAVATGRPAFGHFPIIRPGLVVFFEGENPDSVWHNRLAAIQHVHGPVEHFRPVSYSLPLNNERQLEANLDALRELAATQPIALIVNDTYRRSVGAESIIRDDVATKAAMKLEDIAAEFKCAVLVTAHAPKGNDADISGSQELENILPWSLRIKGRHDSAKRLLAVDVRQGDKARDFEPVTPFSVECQQVEFTRGDGKQIRNPILGSYRPKAAAKAEAPEDDVAELAKEVAQTIKAPPAAAANGHDTDREAQIKARLIAGESRTKIAREVKCNKALVIKIAREIENV